MKRRGFIDPPESSKRSQPLPLHRRGSGPLRNARQSSILESDLFGIPLEIWEDRHQDPEQTVICPTADENDIAPITQADERQVMRPLTTNLIGINIEESEHDDDWSSDKEDEDENKENKLGSGDLPADDEMEASIDKQGATVVISDQSGVIDITEIQEDEETPSIDDLTAAPSVTVEKASYSALEPVVAPEADDISPEEIIADGPSSSPVFVDDFHLALMIFTTTADISVRQYQALIEVLALATPDSISSLPRSLKTLRERCRKTFPLSVVRARPVEVSTDSTPPKTDNPRLAYYFETSEYCKLWLSNPKLYPQIYKGMGEIVNNVSELWQGDAWMESVRSTSGQFAYIKETEPPAPGSLNRIERMVPLLPSDCVMFKDSVGGLALGRVKGIGIDRRQAHPCTSAIINRLVPPYLLSPAWAKAYLDHLDHRSSGTVSEESYTLGQSTTQELVMLEAREIVPCSSIFLRVWVYFTDYQSIGELKYSLLPEEPKYCVRMIAYLSDGKHCIRPVYKRHRVAAEGELIELSREYVLSNLVEGPPLDDHSLGSTMTIGSPQVPTARPKRISLPFSAFLDGFGLYRNAYHSLKGMYITPAGLDVFERERLSNLYVLMIGPFRCSEREMALCLQRDSCMIGKGLELTLYLGEKAFVTAFPLLMTGDMPQQNQNAGVKTHLATFGCRSCLVEDKDRGNLNLDIAGTGRYNAPTKRFYDQAISLRTQRARLLSLQSQGLTLGGPYFTKCYTMLDPLRAYPNDSMHAELRLAKYFEEALIDGLLSSSGIAAYRQAWNDIEMPYKWGQPQNPVNHKGSMVFSEHGRVAIINPFALMHMFTNDRWKHTSSLSQSERNQHRLSYVKRGVNARLQQSFQEETRAGINHKLQIIQAAFGLATAINLTLKETLSPIDREQFNTTIWGMRHTLRRIFACASGEKTSFKNYANVPNIHLGLHYEQDLLNFGTTRNSTTMMGEQKHKVFKVHAPHTNSRENDLQLLKITNTSQTLRFMLDGIFQGSSPEALLASRVQSIIDHCKTLQEFVCGVQSSMPSPDIYSGIEDSRSLLCSSKTGRAVMLKNIRSDERSSDYSIMVALYKSDYGISLSPGMRLKIHYWGYFAGNPRPNRQSATKTRRYRVKVNEFLKLRGSPSMFYRVKRIFTTTIGTMIRVFFVLEELERVREEEVVMSPYPVLRGAGRSLVVGIEKVEPLILHFVSKGVGVWWFNPYVPYFI